MQASLSPLRAASVLWGLCAQVWAPQACPLLCGAWAHSAPWPSLLVAGPVCPLLPRLPCALGSPCPLSACAAPHPAAWAHPLCAARFLQPSQFPEPTVWLGPQSASCSQAEKCRLLCFLPSKPLLSPVFKTPQLLLAGEGASLCMGTPPVS